MNTIKITRKQALPIIRATFPNYNGRKVKVEFRESITFFDTNWGGGTKNTYAFVRADGAIAHYDAPAPWVNPVEGKTVPLPPDVIVVCHSIFCGQDCGLTIYAHPSLAEKMLLGGEKQLSAPLAQIEG